MSEPRFASSTRPSLVLPVLFALVALALAAGLAIHFFPATSVDIAHVRTELLPTHTVYKNDSLLLGTDRAEDVLFVATTLTIDDKLRSPIYLEDFKLTITDPNGAEATVKGVDKRDLGSLQASFPALQPMLTQPLLRDTTIEPKHSVTGTIVFPVTLPKSVWDARRSAVVTVALYHQPSLYQAIPKS